MRRLLAAAFVGTALLAAPASAGPDPIEKIYELTGLEECMDCVPPFCNVAQCETTDNLLHEVWSLIG